MQTEEKSYLEQKIPHFHHALRLDIDIYLKIKPETFQISRKLVFPFKHCKLFNQLNFKNGIFSQRASSFKAVRRSSIHQIYLH